MTATEYLKSNVCSYVWQKHKKHESWKVSTWSKRVNYQVILKEGTEEDIKNLPPETRKNKKRKKGVEASSPLLHFAAIACTHNKKPQAPDNPRKSQSSLPTKVKNKNSTKGRSSPATRTNKRNSRVSQPYLSRPTKKPKPSRKETKTTKSNSSQRKKKIVLKKNIGTGTLESAKCNICNKNPSNHYCRHIVRGTGVYIEGQKEEICGKLTCMVCKLDWGNPEDYANCCKEHGNT